MPVLIPDPNKPIVLVDVDGPLADFNGGALNELRYLPGRRDHNFTHKDVVSYRLETCLGLEQGEMRALKQRWTRPGFCVNLPVQPGAQEAIDQLKSIANVYPVTAPFDSPTWAAEREAWLEKHFDIDRVAVVQTEQKWLVDGHVLIDDKAPNLRPWAARFPRGIAVLWDMESNANEPWDGVRTQNWSVVINVVKALAG
jgi:5'(3')-deoxyribonucleotidase